VQPALTDYAILLVFLQFAFGILIISSHFAHRDLVKSVKNNILVKIKESAFYSWSSIISLFSCYVMAIFFLHSSVIFSPIHTNAGEFNIIVGRWLLASYVPIYFWIVLFLFVAAIRFWREPIASVAKP